MYKNDNDAYNYQEIPIKFDARKKWIRCKTIGEVRDQGNCGSDWVSEYIDELMTSSSRKLKGRNTRTRCLRLTSA